MIDTDKLAAVVRPPVGTVSVCGKYVLAWPLHEPPNTNPMPWLDRERRQNARPEQAQPDPLSPAWQGAMQAWLEARGEARASFDDGYWIVELWTTGRGTFAEHSEVSAAEARAALVLAVAEKEAK